LTDLADLPLSPPPDHAAATNGSSGRSAGREVRRRRALPGGRAVVGGFLVAASAVGVFAAYADAGAAPRTSYVVVVDEVVAGQRLRPADLALVPLDLPAAQQAVSFTDADLLVDAVALGPMAAGQLVQLSDVARPVGGEDRAQISLAVRPGSALGGSRTYLRGGELVDVLVTYTSAGAPETSTVARDAVVVDVLTGGEAIGGSGAVTVVLAVPPEELEAVAQAGAAGEVTLVRTTGLAPEARMGAAAAAAAIPPAPAPLDPGAAGAPPAAEG
jgi:Flp pilus assembly protein CpaB